MEKDDGNGPMIAAERRDGNGSFDDFTNKEKSRESDLESDNGGDGEKPTEPYLKYDKIPW